MKICPKCRGLYFDQDQQCDNCKIELLDKDDFNTTLGEYYQMNHSQRVANKYNPQYEIVCKYQFPEIYEYNEQKSQQEYKALQRKAQQKMIEKEQIEKQQNAPKCPICQSTNLSKITTVQKAGKIALFGIFGMGDNGKTWKCNNCGSKF